MLKLDIELTKNPKEKPVDESQLGFGRIFTDHMFLMDYETGKGWNNARIVPYAPVSFDLATMVFHYGQAVFEGLKAYRAKDGGILLFRPRDNFLRMNKSTERMCMPLLDADEMVDSLKQLLRIEKDWVPSSPGTSLYIRPTMIGTDVALGVRPSDKYLFFIILSPVGAYYAEGLKPVSISVEEDYVRAVRGGTGSIKCAGNYAASLITGQKAHDCGCVQALWLDGVHRKYVEEVGSMNIFFKIGGRLVTPALTGSILPGITRNSIIRLARDMGIAVEERQIEVGELFRASEDGMLEEVFGTGTAAVISGVSELVLGKKRIVVNDGKLGALSAKLYDLLTGIQYGALPDKYGWVERV